MEEEARGEDSKEDSFYNRSLRGHSDKTVALCSLRFGDGTAVSSTIYE